MRYRGADVAIKKLKKQNMGNQQLEDLAKEAMVMVGLRHPNILLHLFSFFFSPFLSPFSFLFFPLTCGTYCVVHGSVSREA